MIPKKKIVFPTVSWNSVLLFYFPRCQLFHKNFPQYTFLNVAVAPWVTILWVAWLLSYFNKRLLCSSISFFWGFLSHQTTSKEKTKNKKNVLLLNTCRHKTSQKGRDSGSVKILFFSIFMTHKTQCGCGEFKYCHKQSFHTDFCKTWFPLDLLSPAIKRQTIMLLVHVYHL